MPIPQTEPPDVDTFTQQLLSRPREQRIREFKYRCAQSIVFGVPVLLLQYFGHQLGGPESPRWIAIFQALLAGWVMYVGAAGMLFEGLLRLGEKRWSDLLVSLAAVALYLWSVVSVIGIFTTGAPWYGPLLFHVSVSIIAVWTAGRWFFLNRSQDS